MLVYQMQFNIFRLPQMHNKSQHIIFAPFPFTLKHKIKCANEFMVLDDILQQIYKLIMLNMVANV